jgi:membrane protein DedA with SNARE-associated domain
MADEPGIFLYERCPELAEGRPGPSAIGRQPSAIGRRPFTMKKISLIAGFVAALFLLSFGICLAMGWFTPEWTRDQLEGLSVGACILAVIGLLLADLILPVPSTVVLSVAGMLIDWRVAAAAGFAGMMLGNLIGYGACRLAGQKAFVRFVSEGEAKRFSNWLDRWGPVTLIVSRPVPMMAEVLSCLAGLGRMGFARFLGALTVGTIPFVAFFAWMGERHGRVQEEPGFVLLVSLAVPALSWAIFLILQKKTPE